MTNHSPHPQTLRADFRVHFLRADGKTSPKVFRVPLETLAPGERVLCRRKISLAHKTTRRHYPGTHRVEIQLNGEVFQAGCFDLLP